MPEHARPRPRSRPFAALAAGTLIALTGACEPALAQFAPLVRLPVKARAPRDVSGAIATIRDADAAPATRAAAAQELVHAQTPDDRARVLALLAPDADAEARRVILAAASEVTTSDPWMVPALSALVCPPGPPAPAVDDADQLKAIAALGAVRSRESAQTLVNALCKAESPEERDAAHAALVRSTGRAALKADCQAWSEWLSRAMIAPELEWMREQAEGQADRADALSRQLALATGRIVDVLRRSYIDAPGSEDRVKLVTAWLADDLPEIRRLGVELVNRELANARQIDPRVARLALGLLADPVPDLRARAADLAFSLGPDGAGEAVANALLSETDPLVAAALLRATTRWPSPMTMDVVLEWAEIDPEAGARGAPKALRTARRAALDASAALGAASMLTPANASRLLGVLRTLPDAEIGGGGCALLTRLGSDEDRSRVVGMLQTPALKPAAADGLAADARGVAVLLEAASRDSTLFPLAARAVTRWAASAESFARLSTLPAPTPEAMRDGLMQLAAVLEPDDLLAAARSTPDLTLRESLLSRLATGPTARRGGWTSAVAGPDPALTAGLLLLAQTRLDLGQPSGAVAALEALSATPNSVDPVLRASMMTVALLWLNRVDEAASCGAGADAWIDGLKRASTQPHAREIVAAIRSRFGTVLTTEQTDRLSAIESALPRPR